MNIFQFFEYIRRSNADFYTASPLEQMSEEELIKLAQQVGMTVWQLREESRH